MVASRGAEEFDRRLADCVHGRTVTARFFADEFGRDVDAFEKHVALLFFCHLVDAFVGVPVEANFGSGFHDLTNGVGECLDCMAGNKPGDLVGDTMLL